jgi:uncharacterized protein
LAGRTHRLRAPPDGEIGMSACHRIVLAALLLSPFALAMPAEASGPGPSFSCYGRLAIAEQIICDDAELSRLDQTMSDLYDQAGGPRTSPAEVHAYIRDRLQMRTKCRTRRCIEAILRDEIDYLQDYLDHRGNY